MSLNTQHCETVVPAILSARWRTTNGTERIQKTTKMEGTESAGDNENSTALVLAEDTSAEEISQYYPLVQYGRLQFSVPQSSFKSKIRTPMPISLEDFATFVRLKSNPSRAADRWRSFLNVKNLCEVIVDEGSYVYSSFDVAGHPSMKYRLIPIPGEVATKLFPEMHAEAIANPERYDLKLDAERDDVRARHHARLAVLEWRPTNCLKKDTKRPGVPSPREQSSGWRQVPAARFIPSCLKDVEEHTTAFVSNAGGNAGPERRVKTKTSRQNPYPPWLSVRQVNDGITEKEVILHMEGDVTIDHDIKRGIIFVRHKAPLAVAYSAVGTGASSVSETIPSEKQQKQVQADDDGDGAGDDDED